MYIVKEILIFTRFVSKEFILTKKWQYCCWNICIQHLYLCWSTWVVIRTFVPIKIYLFISFAYFHVFINHKLDMLPWNKHNVCDCDILKTREMCFYQRHVFSLYLANKMYFCYTSICSLLFFKKKRNYTTFSYISEAISCTHVGICLLKMTS